MPAVLNVTQLKLHPVKASYLQCIVTHSIISWLSCTQQYEQMVEKKEDTKVLFGWNEERVIISFRGTASLKV